MPTPSQLSFCDLATRYEALRHNGDPLEALAAHVPGAEFRPALKKVLRRSKRKQGGRPSRLGQRISRITSNGFYSSPRHGKPKWLSLGGSR